MSNFLPFVFLVLIAVLGFGAHSAICNMHADAAEHYWAVGGDKNKFRWSHAYCVIVGAPTRWLVE